MPRIRASNIAEHVATQEQAVFTAAVRLFSRDGVANVTAGDIAKEVGLARTSLYRYFPTKASIVHRWFESAVTPLIDAGNAIADAPVSRRERLERWVDLQLDFLADPDNQAMMRAALETDEMPDDIRSAIVARHQDLYRSLRHILAPDVQTPDAVTEARVTIVAGLVRILPDLERRGIPASLARAELQRAAAVIAG